MEGPRIHRVINTILIGCFSAQARTSPVMEIVHGLTAFLSWFTTRSLAGPRLSLIMDSREAKDVPLFHTSALTTLIHVPRYVKTADLGWML